MFGAKKNRPIETVLLSTHNTCFSLEIIKKISYTLLSGGLGIGFNTEKSKCKLTPKEMTA